MDRIEQLFASKKFLPLEEALSLQLPEKTFWVYKLTVGGKFYVGFTGQEPKIRVEQHVQSARNGSENKVHVALRRYGYLNKLEILSQHTNEILALIAEISAIEELKPELNMSQGGEGSNFLVREEELSPKEKIFVVELLKKARRDGAKAWKNDSYHLFDVFFDINQRYEKKERRFDKELVKYRNSKFRDPKDFIGTITSRSDLFSYYELRRLHFERLFDLDNAEYGDQKFADEWGLIFLHPSDHSITITLGGKPVEVGIDPRKKKVFNSKLFPNFKRVIYIDKEPAGMPKYFENIRDAMNFARNLPWFRRGKELKIFRPDDVIWGMSVKCGTYQTGFLNLQTKTNYKIELFSVADIG